MKKFRPPTAEHLYRKWLPSRLHNSRTK